MARARCGVGEWQPALLAAWAAPTPSPALQHSRLTAADCEGAGRHLALHPAQFQLLGGGAKLWQPGTNLTYSSWEPQQFCVEMFRRAGQQDSLQVWNGVVQ